MTQDEVGEELVQDDGDEGQEDVQYGNEVGEEDVPDEEEEDEELNDNDEAVVAQRGTHYYSDVWYNEDTPGKVALNNKIIHFRANSGAQLKLDWARVGRCHLSNPPAVLNLTLRETGNKATFEIRDCRHIDELKAQLDECMTPDPDNSEQEVIRTRRTSEAAPIDVSPGHAWKSGKKGKMEDPIEDPKERPPRMPNPFEPEPDCLKCLLLILTLLILLVIVLYIILHFVLLEDDDDEDDDTAIDEARNTTLL